MENLFTYIAIAVIAYFGLKMLKGVGPNKISQDKAKEMMNGEVYILDVREPHEYASGHIKKASNAPLGNIEKKANKIVKDKSKTVLVYCQSGSRSASATRKLVSLGYTNVYNFGGIMSWKYGTVR